MFLTAEPGLSFFFLSLPNAWEIVPHKFQRMMPSKIVNLITLQKYYILNLLLFFPQLPSLRLDNAGYGGNVKVTGVKRKTAELSLWGAWKCRASFLPCGALTYVQAVSVLNISAQVLKICVCSKRVRAGAR